MTIVAAIIVILVLAAVAAVYISSISSSKTSSTSSSSIISPSTSSSSSSSTVLTIDDIAWPAGNLNELGELITQPFPNWQDQAVYQTLVGTNQTAQFKNGVIQYLPELASNWTVSGSAYTFNLRQNVNFSNGDAFNAYQVWLNMYGWYYLAANSSSWLDSYALFNMTNVNFGNATVSMLANNGGVIKPDQAALNVMMNSRLADLRYKSLPDSVQPRRSRLCSILPLYACGLCGSDI